MNPQTARRMTAAGIALFVLTVIAVAQAQPDDGFDLFWYTIDGGGDMFSTGPSEPRP